MTTIYIETNEIPHLKLPGLRGEAAEILNRDLAGAENVVGTLRWLSAGQRLDAASSADQLQLIYLMDGAGTITLEAKDYQVGKGAGIYLGPSESASITAGESLKLFHLVVPKAKG